MPTYEYQCNKCSEEFELRRKRLDKSPVVCPACGKKDCKKLISASSFHLKGGGWFDEHYGLKESSSKKDKVKNEANDSSEATSESTEDTSSESKSESKPAKDTKKTKSKEKKTKKTKKAKNTDD